MRRQGWVHTQSNVAYRTHLQADALFHHVLQQTCVIEAVHPVSQPLGTERPQGAPHTFWARRLTSMWRAVQARGTRAIEPLLEALGRIALFGPTQAQSHDAVVSTVDRHVSNEVQQRQVRMQGHRPARDVEDPAQLHTKVVPDALAAAGQAVEERLSRTLIHLRSGRK